MDDKVFFDHVRASFGNLGQGQVDGFNALLNAWDLDGDGDQHKLAYVLATAWHETAATMQPIAEYGHGAGHDYGVADFTGKSPYGRGYVQLTFRANYVKADDKLNMGGRLAANYDLALDPHVAGPIIVLGMMQGWFTGKKLGDFISATYVDFTQARTIVNGLDRASLIAGYAVSFASALTAAGYSGSPVPAPAPSPVPPPQPKPPVPPANPNSAWAEIGLLLSRLFAAIFSRGKKP
jgi:putative chitinase